MPVEVVDALKQARKDQASSVNDKAWLEKLAARFASRIRLPRYRPEDDGAETSADPGLVTRVPGHITRPDPRPHPPHTRKPKVRNTRQPRFAVEGKNRPASRTMLNGGLPNCIFSDDPENFENGIAVTWTEPSKADPHGLITIYRGHGLFQHIVKLFQKDYPGYHADKVRDIVEAVYKAGMILRVAMVHGNMRRFANEERFENMLMSEALTTSLFGMAAEDAMIRQELVKALGRGSRRQRQVA